MINDAGEHQIWRRVGLQRAGAGDNQRAAGDDRICGGDRGGVGEWAGHLFTSAERRSAVVLVYQCFALSGVAGALVQRPDAGIQSRRRHDFRC